MFKTSQMSYDVSAQPELLLVILIFGKTFLYRQREQFDRLTMLLLITALTQRMASGLILLVLVHQL